MKTIFMCPPTRFDVNYVINPWMEGNYHKVDHRQAAEQWERLRYTLLKVGVKLLKLAEPPADCPDAVFTANAGLIFKGKFIPSYFKFLERANEEGYFIQEMAARNYQLAGMNISGSRAQQSFEGAGDALYDRQKDILWLGFGFRTELGFKPVLEEALEEFDTVVRPLELVDPRFYHLDTCFCPLDDGNALWYPPAFSEHSQYTIRTWYPDAIEASEEDAVRFACNAVSDELDIVLPLISTQLEERLTQAGYSVHQVDMSQYLRSGGACKCLTIEAIV
jgi:N-dimethylarginine dimethylaminohydrolase